MIGGTFNVVSSKINIFLAHHELVEPAYLIEIKSETDVQKFVSDALYKILEVKRFTTSKTTNAVNKCNIKYLKEYIEKELALLKVFIFA